MHVRYGALGIGLVAWLMVGMASAASAVQWQSSLDRALVLASQSNRLVLVHFWGDGCPPCAWMEQEVFSRIDVASAIDRRFVAVKVNKDQLPNLASQFGVAAVPTDVILTPQGQVVDARVGRTSAAEFMGHLDQVAQAYFGQQNGGYAMQAPGNPAQASGYPQNSPPQYPAMQQPSQAPAAYPPGSQFNMAAQNAPTSQYPGMQSDQSMAAPVTPRYSGQYDRGGDPQFGYPANQGPNPAGQGAMSASVPSGNPYPSNSYMPSANAVAQSPAAPAQPASQPNAAGAEAGNPPLALDGYCAVSLERTMRLDPQPKWVLGDPRWGLRHEGRTYLFAGPEEQQAFFSNPGYYAPLMSGVDVVARVESGQELPGIREFGARWRDHVYLFVSKENFEKFQANPSFYEAEIFGSQQNVGRPVQSSAQNVGARVNPGYGYR